VASSAWSLVKALLDTNVLSYWLDGAPSYERRLLAMMAAYEQQATGVFISAVTLQELAVWGLAIGRWPAMRERVLALAEPLAFTQPTAERAAALFHDTKAPKPKGKGANKEAGKDVRARLDVWHRDAAIVATAWEQNIDEIVTCDQPLAARFKNHFKGRITVI